MTVVWIVLILFFLVLGLICALKGKYVMAALGVLLPVWLWPIGAIRLAKPNSLWAHRFYDGAKMVQARERYSKHHRPGEA
jgi:hypothetical protein